MRHLVLVRHGESEINAINRHTRVFCGQFDTPLTERGREQARTAGKLLGNYPALRFSSAVSSCHARSRETLALLVEHLGYPVEVLPPLAGLNERSLGDFEGLAEADVFAAHPQYRDDPCYSAFQNHFEQKAPCGENLTDVTLRAWAALESLELQTTGDLLIVSHYNTIRCLLGQALRLSLPEILELRVKNATPIVLRWGNSFELVAESPADASPFV